MRLLLTVVRASELETALRAEPDVLDLKDPARGSLGPPAPALVEEVARRVPSRSPAMSVPLGDGPHDPEAVREAASLAAARGAGYVKVGLLGHGRPEEAVEVLDAAREGIAAAADREVELVAVGFADAGEGEAPSPTELPGLAARAGADRVMLDTREKGAGPVTGRLGRAALARWLAAARGGGLGTALAGGLDAGAIRGLAGLPVDVVGVRGGACRGGDRSGRLDASRTRAVAEAVRWVNARGAGALHA